MRFKILKLPTIMQFSYAEIIEVKRMSVDYSFAESVTCIQSECETSYTLSLLVLFSVRGELKVVYTGAVIIFALYND